MQANICHCLSPNWIYHNYMKRICMILIAFSASFFFFDCHIDLFIYDQLEALLRIWFYDTVPILPCKFTFWSLFMALSLGSALIMISKQFTVSSILKSNPLVSGNFPLNDGGLTWPWFYLQSGAPNEKIIQNHLIKHIIVKCILVFKQWI